MGYSSIRLKPAIVVVGYNRALALNRLLNALDKAHYPENVPLIISIDHSDNADVCKVADDFAWNHGEKRVIKHERNLGLRAHVLTCGDLTQEYGSIIMLEDDLYVSPWFYDYASQALGFYQNEQSVSGIALYSININGHAKKLPFFPYQDGASAYFAQMVCSWGQAWTAAQWQGFRTWYDQGQEVLDSDQLPPAIKNWKDHSWVKIFSKYLVESGSYFVYPHTSYSTNMGDLGVHFKTQETTFQVPLQMGEHLPHFHSFNESVSIYDIYLDMHPICMNKLQPTLKDYDYVVDLFGFKQLELYDQPYVLTQKSVRKSIKSYGRNLIPWELNIIENIPGNEIHLAKTADVLPQRNIGADIYSYFYSAIPLRPLIGLSWQKLKEKTPFKWFV